MKKKTLTIGITGHRHLKNQQTENFARRKIRELLIQYLALYPQINALSALAEGADTIFAQEALNLGIPLTAVIPFTKYEDDFSNPDALKQFRQLLSKCQNIVNLNHTDRSDDAYLEAGIWIVDHCDLLFAVWDGKPAAGKGGTGDVVNYAISEKVPVIHVDISNHSIKELVEDI